jgi:hypothetical protein
VTMAPDQISKYPRRINEREKPVKDDTLIEVGLTQAGVEDGPKCTYA